VAFTVISENSTKEPHRLIAASIGLALPSDKSMYGYLSEHHSFGETEEVAGEYAEELAAEMLATTLNVEFDPDLSWDEKKEVYRISNRSCAPSTSRNPRSATNAASGPQSSAPRSSSAKTTKLAAFRSYLQFSRL